MGIFAEYSKQLKSLEERKVKKDEFNFAEASLKNQPLKIQTGKFTPEGYKLPDTKPYYKNTSIRQMTDEDKASGTPLKAVNWEDYRDAKNNYENIKLEYGENSRRTKEAKSLLDTLYVPKGTRKENGVWIDEEDKRFSVEKDIVNPLALGVAKGLSFNLLDPELDTSNTRLAKGVETAGNVGAGLLTNAAIYGIANKALAGVKAFQAIDKVSPFLSSVVKGQVADLAIQSPVVIGKGIQEGKKAEDIAADWGKDQLMNLALNTAFAGFEAIPRIKQARADRRTGKITKPEFEAIIKDETAKRFTQAESDIANRNNINAFKSGKITQEEFLKRQDEIYQTGIDSGKALDSDIFGNARTKEQSNQLGLPFEDNKVNIPNVETKGIVAKVDRDGRLYEYDTVNDIYVPTKTNIGTPKQGTEPLPIYKEADRQLQQEIDNLKNVETPKASDNISSSAPKEKIEKAKDTTEIPIEEVNATFKPKKVNIIDYLRTPQRVLEKMGLKNEAQGIIDGYNAYLDELPKKIDEITSWWGRAGKDKGAAQRIFNYLDGKVNIGKTGLLTEEEKEIAEEMRKYLSDLADRLGIPIDKRKKNYITHIFEQSEIEKDFDPAIASVISDKVPGSVYDPFLQERKNVLGYKEDVFAALDAYTKRAIRKIHMDPALKELAKAAETFDKASANWKYIKKYGDRINMRPTDVDTLVDNFIKDTPVGYSLGARPVTVISRNVRQVVYRGTLGLNFGSAIRNLTQGTNTFAMLGSRWTAKGYADTIKAMTSKSDELVKAGVLRQGFIQDRSLSATKKGIEKLDKGLFYFFEKAEEINRGAAYYGAKARALSQGKSLNEAMKQGTEMARKTQFTFGSVDTPVSLQYDIMKLFTQFMSFNVKQTEFISEMAKNAYKGIKEGEIKAIAPVVRWLGSSVVVLGTVGKLFGFDVSDMIPFWSNVTGEQQLGQTPPIKLLSDTVGAAIGNPDKYGNVNPNVLKRFTDVAAKDLPAFVPGGVQAKKTIQGIEAVSKGASANKSGKVQYAIDQTPGNYIRGALFGKSNLDEAQKYFDSGNMPLSESQTETLKQAAKQGFKPMEVYNAIQGIRDLQPENGRKTVTLVQKRKYLATLFSGEKLRQVIKLLKLGDSQ